MTPSDRAPCCDSNAPNERSVAQMIAELWDDVPRTFVNTSPPLRWRSQLGDPSYKRQKQLQKHKISLFSWSPGFRLFIDSCPEGNEGQPSAYGRQDDHLYEQPSQRRSRPSRPYATPIKEMFAHEKLTARYRQARWTRFWINIGLQDSAAARGQTPGTSKTW